MCTDSASEWNDAAFSEDCFIWWGEGVVLILQGVQEGWTVKKNFLSYTPKKRGSYDMEVTLDMDGSDEALYTVKSDSGGGKSNRENNDKRKETSIVEDKELFEAIQCDNTVS